MKEIANVCLLFSLGAALCADLYDRIKAFLVRYSEQLCEVSSNSLSRTN